MSDFPLTGSRNCGAARFDATAPPVTASCRHCERCQRRSGGETFANAHPAAGTFQIVPRKDTLPLGSQEAAGQKWFCDDCDSGRSPQSSLLAGATVAEGGRSAELTPRFKHPRSCVVANAGVPPAGRENCAFEREQPRH